MNEALLKLDLRCNYGIGLEASQSVVAAMIVQHFHRSCHQKNSKKLSYLHVWQERKTMMEEFNGIPVKALLENDDKTTELNLTGTGCEILEACVLSYCLKVIALFVYVCVLLLSGWFNACIICCMCCTSYWALNLTMIDISILLWYGDYMLILLDTYTPSFFAHRFVVYR